ncbi:MAG: metalloregulator ArsR/SmtB family transcription factor [Pseudomonadota bacterium]
MTDQSPVHDLTLEEVAQAFAALGSEQRLSVLRTLVRAGPIGLSMGDLARRTEIAASTLTHHLRFLTQAGLVSQARQGRSVICAAASFETVDRLSRFLLQECCADAPAEARHDPEEHRT